MTEVVCVQFVVSERSLFWRCRREEVILITTTKSASKAESFKNYWNNLHEMNEFLSPEATSSSLLQLQYLPVAIQDNLLFQSGKEEMSGKRKLQFYLGENNML